MKNNPRYTQLISIFFLILWMAALLSAYYLYHKPIDLTLVTSALRVAWILMVVLWILSLAGGLGRRISALPSFTPVERAFVQLMLGLGIFAILILILGSIGVGFKVVLWLLFFVPLPFLFRSIRSWWGDWRLVLSGWSESSLFAKVLSILCGLILTQALLTALAPPMHYDALTYHLALPKLYLDSGGILAGRDWLRGGMPQTGEMLYTWALSAGQLSAAPVLGWAVGALAVLTLVSFIMRYTSSSAGWVGAGALLCGSGISSALGWGYIDWFCLSFGLAAIITLQASLEQRNQHWLFLSGILCGMAFGTKYTAGVILAGAAVVFTLYSLKNRREMRRGLAILSAGFLLPAIPWLLKNVILVGNPLSPYFWGSTAFPVSRQMVIQGSTPFGNWLDIVFLPFRATILGADGGEGYSHTIGVLFLLLGGLCWIKPDMKDEHKIWYRTMLTISIVTLVLWIAGNQFSGMLVQNRMYYAAFPAFAALAAVGYFKVSQIEIPRVRLVRIINAVVLLVVGLNAIQGGRELIRSQAPDYLTGVITAEEYKEHNLGWYQRAVAAMTKSTEKTLLIYEPRGLDCLQNCQPDEILDRWSFDYHQSGSCDAVLAGWRAKEYTRVLVNQAGIDFFKTIEDPNHTRMDLDALQACLGTLTPIQEYGSAYSLFPLQ